MTFTYYLLCNAFYLEVFVFLTLRYPFFPSLKLALSRLRPVIHEAIFAMLTIAGNSVVAVRVIGV